MNIQDDTTYQAEVAAAGDWRQEALFQYHITKPATISRADYVKDTDKIFAEYHCRLFAAMDAARLRLIPAGLPPLTGDPSLN